MKSIWKRTNAHKLFRVLSILLVLLVLLSVVPGAVAEPIAQPPKRLNLGTFWLNCDWGQPVIWTGEAWCLAPVVFEMGWRSRWGESGVQRWTRTLSPGVSSFLFSPSTNDYRIIWLKATSWGLVWDVAGCKTEPASVPRDEVPDTYPDSPPIRIAPGEAELGPECLPLP
jgi:hypothetical protein